MNRQFSDNTNVSIHFPWRCFFSSRSSFQLALSWHVNLNNYGTKPSYLDCCFSLVLKCKELTSTSRVVYFRLDLKEASLFMFVVLRCSVILRGTIMIYPFNTSIWKVTLVPSINKIICLLVLRIWCCTKQMVKLWGDFTCWAFCGVKGLTIIAQGDCAEFREKKFSLNLSRALSATSHICENAHFTTVQIVERFSRTKFEKEKNLSVWT